MSAPRFGREAFHRWLAGKEPEADVGDTCDPCGCPIVNFFAEHGHPSAEVYISYYYLRTGGRSYAFPAWVGDWYAAIKRGPVTAAEALAVLTQSAPPRGEGERA